MRRSVTLGAILIVLGLSGTGFPVEPGAEPISGRVAFDGAHVDGELTVTSRDGGLTVRGEPTSVRLRGTHLDVTIVTVVLEHVNDPVGGEPVVKLDERHDTYAFSDAEVTWTELGTESLLYAFVPNPRAGRPADVFRVDVGSARGEALEATVDAVTVDVGDAGAAYAFHHNVSAPAFGLAQGRLEAPFRASLSRAAAAGDFFVVLDEAAFDVAGVEGAMSFRTGEHPRDDTTLAGYTAVFSTERSYALINATGAALDVTTGGADGRFVAARPVYHLVGDVVFDARETALQINSRRLDPGPGQLRVSGDLRLEPRAALLAPATPLTAAEPRMSAGVAGEATLVAMNGRVLTLQLPEVVQAAGWAALVLGFLATLWSAVQKGTALPLLLYHRMLGGGALAHKNRERIHGLIVAQPFIHPRELERRTGLGYGCLDHHLEVLTRQGVVSSVPLLGREHYYPFRHGFDKEDMKKLALLGEPNRAGLARAIAGRPRTQAELQGLLGLRQPSVSKHLARLEAEGLIVARGSRSKVYVASPLLQRWLATAEAGHGTPAVGPAAASA